MTALEKNITELYVTLYLSHVSESTKKPTVEIRMADGTAPELPCCKKKKVSLFFIKVVSALDISDILVLWILHPSTFPFSQK